MIASHTIPAFYLKQFSSRAANRKADLVWVYERNQHPAQRNIRKQGKQNGYFGARGPDGSIDDKEHEKAMARLENECNESLVCARSDLFDRSSTRHRRRLAFYAALLYARSTQRRSHSEHVGKQVIADLASAAEDEALMTEIADKINSLATESLFTAASVRDLVLERVRLDAEPAERNTQFVEGIRGLVEHFTEILLRKNWQTWKAPAGTEFVTSDNPVINFIMLPHGPFHPGYGFNKGFTAFPLAPDACLIMGVKVGAPDVRMVDVSIVSRMNEAIIGICDRYTYSRSFSAEIGNLAQQVGGIFRYGKNALLPVGLNRPTAHDFLRRQFGLTQ